MSRSRFLAVTAGLLLLASLGGALAQWLGLPLPWMLGSLVAIATFVLTGPPRAVEAYSFPNAVREKFIALIGIMVGSQVTPDVLAMAADLPLTLAALLGFVVVAQFGNTWLFRRYGGYDRATAFFSGSPGGLMESIAMGEASGADMRILTIQQFLRIIVVIVLLPLALSVWAGHPVGSAAGLTAEAAAPVGPVALGLIVVAAFAGIWIAKRLRFPAPQLSGPMAIAAAATLSGTLDLHLPFWLIAVAQLVIGMTLGLRFKGTDLALLRRCIGLSLISVAFMFALGGALAALLWHVTGIEFLALLLSFAPGGVTEMSLVALSLAASPALVSLHHIIRIVLTVTLMGAMAKRYGIGR